MAKTSDEQYFLNEKAVCQRYGFPAYVTVDIIGIFGSVARGEQTENSDVDVYLETSKPNMFALVHIKEDLQSLFGCNVDIVRLRDQMDSLLRNRIEKEGIYV